MKTTIGHHACSKDGGKTKVLADGPFEANKKPYVGRGYYYWERSLQNAIWWGNTWYGEGYYIIESELNISDGVIFDLLGNTEHMELFIQLARRFKEREYSEGRLNIGTFIEFLKEFNKHTPGVFNFKAIRAVEENDSARETFHVTYVKGRPKYINLRPPIFICVIEKKDIILSKQIIHES